MFRTEIVNLANQALWLILILSAPPILISMLFGLLVAIFQAATQIQEQTLSFTFKLVAAILTIIFAGPCMGGHIYQFGLSIFQSLSRWG